MDRLVLELAGEYGVHEALREDREIILVRAPPWSRDGLETRIPRRIEPEALMRKLELPFGHRVSTGTGSWSDQGPPGR